MKIFILVIVFFSQNLIAHECAVKTSYYRRYCLQNTLTAKDYVDCMKKGFFNLAFEKQCSDYVKDLNDLCNKVPVNFEKTADCYNQKIDFDLTKK